MSKMLKKILLLLLVTFTLLINNADVVNAEGEEYYTTIYLVDPTSNHISTMVVSYDKNSVKVPTDYRIKSSLYKAYKNAEIQSLPSSSDNMMFFSGSVDTETDGYKKDAPSYIVYPGFYNEGNKYELISSLGGNGLDRLRAESVSTSLVEDLNFFTDQILIENNIKNVNQDSYLNLLTKIGNAIKEGNTSFDWTNSGKDYTISFTYDVTQTDSDLIKEGGVKYIVFGKDKARFMYSRKKWDEGLYGYIPGDGDHEDMTKDIAWDGIIWYAVGAYNSGYDVEANGFEAFMPNNDVVNDGNSFFDSLVNNITTKLGIPNGVKRIFNKGIYRQNGTYFYGIARKDWVKGASLLYWAASIYSVLVLLASAIKLLGKRGIAVLSPSERVDLRDGIVNIVIAIVLMALFLPIFYLMCYLNYQIVEVMSKFVSEGNYNVFATGFIAKIVYIYIQFRLWIEFLTRGITVLLCYVLAPLAISSIGLGKNNGFFTAWVKELIVNIFIQSIDAIVCGVLYGVASGSMHWLEGLAFAYMVIPLNRWTKNNLFGMRGSGSEAVSDETQRGVQGAATAAIGVTGTVAAGAYEGIKGANAMNDAISEAKKLDPNLDVREKGLLGGALRGALTNTVDRYGAPLGLRGTFSNINDSDFDKVRNTLMTQGDDKSLATLEKSFGTLATTANRSSDSKYYQDQMKDVGKMRRENMQNDKWIANTAIDLNKMDPNSDEYQAVIRGMVTNHDKQDSVNNETVNNNDYRGIDDIKNRQFGKHLEMYSDGNGNYSFDQKEGYSQVDGLEAIELNDQNKNMFNKDTVVNIDGKDYALAEAVYNPTSGKNDALIGYNAQTGNKTALFNDRPSEEAVVKANTSNINTVVKEDGTVKFEQSASYAQQSPTKAAQAQEVIDLRHETTSTNKKGEQVTHPGADSSEIMKKLTDIDDNLPKDLAYDAMERASANNATLAYNAIQDIMSQNPERSIDDIKDSEILEIIRKDDSYRTPAQAVKEETGMKFQDVFRDDVKDYTNKNAGIDFGTKANGQKIRAKDNYNVHAANVSDADSIKKARSAYSEQNKNKGE